MVDLDDFAEVVERHLPGQRVDKFLPEDGDVFGANMNVLGYRSDDDLDGVVVKPVVDLIKRSATDAGRRVDGVWLLRWGSFPGDLYIELAARKEG